jgi:hypothetical protein
MCSIGMRAEAGGRTRRATFALLLASSAVAGCGGGDGKPSAAEQRAALDRWQAKADAVCRKANEAVAKRGWPADLVDLDRLTVRAIAEVRSASTQIQRLPAPEGSERRVRPFLDGLKRLEPVMEQLSSTTERFKPERLNELLPKVQSSLADVEKASKELGLRECAANDEHFWVPDAIRAPVFAQQLADVTQQITRRSKAVTSPAATRQAAARNLDRLSDVIADADRKINTLKPPNWASEEAFDYVAALRDLGGALDEGATELAEPTLTPGELNRVRRKFDRAARLEHKRAVKLAKAVGAVPALRGGGGDDSDSPAGDDAQAA